MKGAICGDVIGSAYEFHNVKTKDFPWLTSESRYTDDSYLTIAIADGLLHLSDQELKDDLKVRESIRASMIHYGVGDIPQLFSESYQRWVSSQEHLPYGGTTNGAIMRCSAAGWIATSPEEASRLGKMTAMPTHDSPQAMKAASILCESIYRLRHGMTKEEFQSFFLKYYPIPNLDEIREDYQLDFSAEGTIQVAAASFLESVNFEDAIRNAVSLGGDSDTIADVAGALAEAYYGIPDPVWKDIRMKLPDSMNSVIETLYHRAEEKGKKSL